MCEIAASLGSDIPVCVLSTPCFMEGRGEILRAPDSMPRIPMLLVNPGVAVPTKDVFAGLETRSGVTMALPRGRFRDTADLLRFLETTRNDLEAPALALAAGDRRSAGRHRARCRARCWRACRAAAPPVSASSPMTIAAPAPPRSCNRPRPAWWVAPTFVPETGIVHEEVGQDIGPTPTTGFRRTNRGFSFRISGPMSHGCAQGPPTHGADNPLTPEIDAQSPRLTGFIISNRRHHHRLPL